MSSRRSCRNCGPLGEPGGAHVEVAAAPGEHGGPGVELGAGLLAGAGGVGLGRLAGLERRQQQLELGDALPARRRGGPQLVDAPLQRLELGLRPRAARSRRAASASDAAVRRASLASSRAGELVDRRRRGRGAAAVSRGGDVAVAAAEQPATSARAARRRRARRR